MKHSQHNENVNGYVAKTDDKTLMYCVLVVLSSLISSIKWI